MKTKQIIYTLLILSISITAANASPESAECIALLAQIDQYEKDLSAIYGSDEGYKIWEMDLMNQMHEAGEAKKARAIKKTAMRNLSKQQRKEQYAERYESARNIELMQVDLTVKIAENCEDPEDYYPVRDGEQESNPAE